MASLQLFKTRVGLVAQPFGKLLAPIASRATYSTSKDVVTATETGELVQADITSGVPEELKERTVRIYRPAKTAMQSGLQQTRSWKLDFEIINTGAQWENPLMGWASSADPVQALRMRFPEKEDAIRFAEKQGWNYVVEEPKTRKFHKKMYADNYKYTPNKLRMIKTK
ncbi:ndufs4 NADH dehydrogenase Fe-S protein subunit [Basidiobolus ranarum]|uniref:NADH dehydrogenase [ubiquinone] iron-sulfur protein 4, mitochondrial n=1 Tax=Basidiobolus ranarum TaxID=34480 RepID=A0ABR2W6R6_9FUNG